MPRRTLLLILGLIIVTGALIFAAFQMNQTQQPAQEVPEGQPTLTPTPPAFTTISFSPNPTTVNPDGSGSVDVTIDTDQNTISGVQLEIAYDPQAITNIQVTPGPFFSDPLIIPQWENIDETTGRISHAQVLTPAQDSMQGEGVIATITFERVPGTTSTQTEMTFLPKTAVTQAGVSASVVKSATGVTIDLGAGQVQGQSQTQALPQTTTEAEQVTTP